jgi:RHS repeat-associated protein
VVHSAQYDPYGGLYKTWVDTYHPKPGFSGKERESGSDLDYFGARYYGHRQYRFLSVDPKIGKDEAIANPLLWNLYAYCRNNPITFLDPDGMAEDRIPKTDKKTIMINLDDQTLKAYEKKEIVFDFNIVSGDDDHPTDIGTFKIFRKEHPYRSKKYDVQMDFAMFFTKDGKAIHQYHGFWGAFLNQLTRSIFGDSIGSHGCVRLKESNAKALYYWTPMYTTVETYK